MTHPDIEVVTYWYYAWCDMSTGMPVNGNPTGTFFVRASEDSLLIGSSQADAHLYRLRHIENVIGKRVHRGCGGEWEIVPEDCEQYKIPMVCLKCGTKIYADM
jgi:hypothetical protein